MESVKQSLGKVAITIDKYDWNDECSYPPLHIVWVSSAAKSYISRKPVPAGIPITDNDYWRPFSAIDEKIIIEYNEFKKQYRSLLICYADCIDGLQKQVNRVNTRLDTGIKFSGNKTGVKLNDGETTDINLYFNTNTNDTASVVELYKDAELIQTWTDIKTFDVSITVSDTTAFVVKANIGGVLYTSGWFVQNTIVPV